MVSPIYNLPELSFVGGDSQKIIFNLYTPQGTAFDTADCEVGFAIINYSNKTGVPILIKETEKMLGDEGVMNVISVELSPEDTLYLYGRYIYQITLKDLTGKVEIPGQGIIDVIRNIHTDFLE